MTLRQLCVLLLGILILISIAISYHEVQAEQQQQKQQASNVASQQQLKRPTNQASSSSNYNKQQQQQQQQEAATNNRCGSKRNAREANGDDDDELAGGKLIAGGLAGYLLADPTNSQLNSSNALDSKLADILDRIGPDMRPLRDFRDFDDISVDVAKRAWKLMHDHALAAANGRLSLVRPIVERALLAANVSGACLSAASKTMDSAERLDSWAIQCKCFHRTQTHSSLFLPVI